MSLFSLVLLEVLKVFGNATISAVAEGAVGRLLTVRAACPNCSGVSSSLSIENRTTNALHCHNCDYAVRQYTNATPRTVRRNAVIGAFATRPHWEAPSDDARIFVPTFDVDVVYGDREELVASVHVTRYEEIQPFYSSRLPFLVRGERTRTTIEVPVPIEAIPDDTDVFAVDVVVQNAWGDELDRVRRLGKAGQDC